jgi:nitrate/TMAO reductase-like tetraheme cytochrome c subunit
VRRGNLRIALIGVLDPRGMGENIGAGLAVEKMETTLTRVLPELRKQADAIVLLAFTDETTLAQLARDFYEVDVVLGGKVSQPAQKLLKENRSLISYAGNEGRALGWLKVRANAGKGAVQAAGDAITLLEDHIPEHPALVAMAAEYRETVRKAKLAVDDPDRLADNMVPGVRARATYTGSQACIECHASAAIAWKKSGHSDAFASLVDRKADADPSCILCHTVGFGTPSGYRRQFGNTQLTDVGCESCHGPGSVHVRERRDHLATTFKFRPLGAGDCQQCHHGEFSRPFDWDGFWPRIKHGKEPVKTASISGQ